MNALSLYVSTCRMVLQSGADDAGAWANISRLLSCLRQALTCSVCEKILNVPTSSSTSACHHNVCKECIGGKKRLKPSCSRCTDYNKFSENNQIKIILQCYKKLCEYIMTSALHRKWSNLNGGSASNLDDLVQEGAEIPSETYHNGETSRNLSFAEQMKMENVGNFSDSCGPTNGDSASYSVSVAESNSTKIMIKRTPTDSEDESSAYESKQSLSDSYESCDVPKKKARLHRVKRKSHTSLNNSKSDFLDKNAGHFESFKCHTKDEEQVNNRFNIDENYLSNDTSDSDD